MLMYILESLSTREQAMMAAHLGSCASCQSKLLDSVKFVGKLAAIKQPKQGSLHGPGRYPQISVDMAASVRILNPALSGKTQARVLSTWREGVKLRVPESVQPGATVQIRVMDTFAFGEIRSCQAVGPAFHIGVHIQDSFPVPRDGVLQAQRSEPRSDVRVSADLKVQGGIESHRITVLDVSRSGLRVRLGFPIPANTRVEISYGNTVVSGEVRYSRELDVDEFNIGINVDHVTDGGEERDGDFDLNLVFGV
jgi:PilZ domain